MNGAQFLSSQRRPTPEIWTVCCQLFAVCCLVVEAGGVAGGFHAGLGFEPG